jgi:hypothetical protein
LNVEGQSIDLTVYEDDVRLEYAYGADKNEITGHILFVRKKQGIESVLLTESSGNYALRATEWNPVNGDETRYYKGKPLVNDKYSSFSIISSNAVQDKEFGSAFKLFIPLSVVFGNPWAPNGIVMVNVKDDFKINIRALSSKYADYEKGKVRNNLFTIKTDGVPYLVSAERRTAPSKIIAEQNFPPINSMNDWGSILAPYFAAIPKKVVPGETAAVIYVLPEGDIFDNVKETLKAHLYSSVDGKKILSADFFNYPIDGHSVAVAMITPPSTIKSGDALIEIESGDLVIGELLFEILERDFIVEVVETAQQSSDRCIDALSVSEKLSSILTTAGNRIYSTGKFITPVDSAARRSSGFGARRFYEYENGQSKTSVHTGIDYAVPFGTEVKAVAFGKVVFAENIEYNGNLIVIEHMPGVYTLYYHLSEIFVNEDDIVNADSVIGLSGNTEFGEHLHWEVRVFAESSDPDILVRRPVLDDEEILKILFSVK